MSRSEELTLFFLQGRSPLTPLHGQHISRWDINTVTLSCILGRMHFTPLVSPPCLLPPPPEFPLPPPFTRPLPLNRPELTMSRSNSKEHRTLSRCNSKERVLSRSNSQDRLECTKVVGRPTLSRSNSKEHRTLSRSNSKERVLSRSNSQERFPKTKDAESGLHSVPAAFHDATLHRAHLLAQWEMSPLLSPK